MSHPVVEHLKNLVPLCEINDDNFIELVRHTVVGTAPAGQVLFEYGDPDDFSHYLLSGKLSLVSPTGERIVLKAEDPQSRYPFAHQNPRQYTAIADTAIKYIKVNNGILDLLLAWNQTTSYVVTEIDESTNQDNDWMFNILRSKLFQKIPAANIQAMFLRFKHQDYLQGETVIKQDEAADDYFVVKHGRCGVYRRAEDGSNELLAELEPGDGFGEEALLADTTRNATVIVLEPGTVMHLTRHDFDALLKEPIIQRLEYEKAQDMVNNGAQWLDIRLEDEYLNDRIPGSLHIPLYQLRLKSDTLSSSSDYIVYCDTGRRSAAAAYLLNQQGFNAYLLENGLNSVPGSELEHS